METIPQQKPEQEETILPQNELQQTLSALLGETINLEEVQGTQQLESNSIELSYTVSDNLFEIRDIKITNPGEGIGRKVVESLALYAESQGMDLIASNVKDESRGFWEHLGFQEGSDSGEFFKAA